MEWKDDGRRWQIFQKELQFPVVWPQKDRTCVIFSLIQGLAFRNTSGKSVSVVSLTRLVCPILLTCKSFLWFLSGVYSCFNLTVSANTHAPWPWPPCDNMSVFTWGYSLRSDKLPEARKVALINHVRSSQSDLNTAVTKDIKVTAA